MKNQCAQDSRTERNEDHGSFDDIIGQLHFNMLFKTSCNVKIKHLYYLSFSWLAFPVLQAEVFIIDTTTIYFLSREVSPLRKFQLTNFLLLEQAMPQRKQDTYSTADRMSSHTWLYQQRSQNDYWLGICLFCQFRGVSYLMSEKAVLFKVLVEKVY